MKDLVTVGSGDGVSFKDFGAISRKLKLQGYDEIVNKRWVVSDYDEGDDYSDTYEARDYVWSCDSVVNIKVVTGDCLMTLTFDDEYSQKLFMESVKAAGFKKGTGEYGGMVNGGADHSVRGTVYYHPKGKYWSGVWVDETPGKVYLVYSWTP